MVRVRSRHRNGAGFTTEGRNLREGFTMGMFATAKTVKTATKAKKPTKASIEITGIEALSAIDHAIKALTALKETYEADVKSEVSTHFVKAGIEAGKRPANFTGTEGKATASCELRKRSSRSGLAEGEIEMLEAAGIATEIAEDVVDTFVINPAYAGDQDLLAKIEKKLSQIKDLPEDFILRQEGVSRRVVSEAALDQIFTLDEETVAALLPVVGTIALKPKFEAESLADVFQVIETLA